MGARLPRAPEAPLPELAEFLAPLTMHFVQRPSAQSLERFVTGLLTEHLHQNCDTLAAVVPAPSEQRLQYLLTDMACDHEDLNGQRVRRMLALPTDGEAPPWPGRGSALTGSAERVRTKLGPRRGAAVRRRVTAL